MRENSNNGNDIRRDLMAITLAVAAAGSATSAIAASDIFFKLGEIKGESVDAKHKGEIEVLSWSWGLIGPTRNSPGVPQRPVGPARDACAQQIFLTKDVDAASPLLMANAALGTTLPSATLALRKADSSQEDYLVITLKDVFVSSVQSGASRGGGDAIETVSLVYSSANVKFRPQDATGKLGDAIEADVPGSCP
jgi:type VI secretion system secreted protein Hcp